MMGDTALAQEWYDVNDMWYHIGRRAVYYDFMVPFSISFHRIWHAIQFTESWIQSEKIQYKGI